MENNIALSVILPSYLEEENLRIILPRLNQNLTSLGICYEVLVIDTTSPLDKTREICQHNEVKHINRKNGNSFGNAVRTGIEEAVGENILFMDADGSHPPEFIPSLYKYVDDYDVIIASRYVKGGHTENGRMLIFMSRVVNLIYSVVLGIRCCDVSNSFRIYKAPLLKELDLCCDNFDVVEEILFKLSRKNKNLKIKEVPSTFKQRMFGKTKRNLLIFTLSYIFTLLKLRFSQ